MVIWVDEGLHDHLQKTRKLVSFCQKRGGRHHAARPPALLPPGCALALFAGGAKPTQHSDFRNATTPFTASKHGRQSMVRPSRDCSTSPVETSPRRWNARVEAGMSSCAWISPTESPSCPARIS